MSTLKLVIFDLSGTTVEDENAVAKSLHAAGQEFDLDASLEDFQRSIGTNKIHLYEYMIARSRGEQLTIEQLEKQRFPEIEAEAMKIFERYTEIMIAHYEQHVMAMPGAEETFEWLHARGIKVATDTGFHGDVVAAIMKRLRWEARGLIDTAVHVEHTGGVGRPAPFMVFYAMQKLGIQSVHEVMKVGDTPSDLLSGYHAGCAGNVGVLSGANPIEVLGQYRHTHILPSVADIPKLIEREGGG
jgi:phosphonatase-like hydrolase